MPELGPELEPEPEPEPVLEPVLEPEHDPEPEPEPGPEQRFPTITSLLRSARRARRCPAKPARSEIARSVGTRARWRSGSGCGPRWPTPRASTSTPSRSERRAAAPQEWGGTRRDATLSALCEGARPNGFRCNECGHGIASFSSSAASASPACRNDAHKICRRCYYSCSSILLVRVGWFQIFRTRAREILETFLTYYRVDPPRTDWPGYTPYQLPQTVAYPYDSFLDYLMWMACMGWGAGTEAMR
jgi:hypothetical protein